MKIKELQLKEFTEDLNTINSEIERIKAKLTVELNKNNDDETIKFFNLKLLQYFESKEKVKEFIKKLDNEIEKEKLEGELLNDQLVNAQ